MGLAFLRIALTDGCPQFAGREALASPRDSRAPPDVQSVSDRHAL